MKKKNNEKKRLETPLFRRQSGKKMRQQLTSIEGKKTRVQYFWLPNKVNQDIFHHPIEMSHTCYSQITNQTERNEMKRIFETSRNLLHFARRKKKKSQDVIKRSRKRKVQIQLINTFPAENPVDRTREREKKEMNTMCMCTWNRDEEIETL